ncbi:RNA polymerase subunit AC19 [Acarospora aff. strigata]|nr:RNA polymerase subunit AC19 [Acarospora aff. strigata]
MPSQVASSQDQPMPDAATVNEDAGSQQEPVLELGEQRIQILPGATDTAASFQFEGEDHTLGNALRYMIMKNPEVEFCGYSIPHPSEAKMNVRIQTYDGTTAYDALEKGFDDLMDLCDAVADKFTTARDAHAAKER